MSCQAASYSCSNCRGWRSPYEQLALKFLIQISQGASTGSWWSRLVFCHCTSLHCWRESQNITKLKKVICPTEFGNDWSVWLYSQTDLHRVHRETEIKDLSTFTDLLYFPKTEIIGMKYKGRSKSLQQVLKTTVVENYKNVIKINTWTA